MKQYPYPFQSQKEYNNYLGCLNALRTGDRVFFNYPATTPLEGWFICLEKENNKNFESYRVLVGSELEDSIFRTPAAHEKRKYLVPAKKICNEILIGKTNLCWIGSGLRLTKIVKYNGEKEKEKKEAGNKKPVRTRRKNAK